MVWVDVLIVLLVVASMLVSLLRGFVREILSLAALVIAFWAALMFAGPAAAYLGWVSDSEPVRSVVAFVTLFLVVLLLGAVVNHLVGLLVKGTGLSGTDRILGMVFGFARGVVLVAAVLVVGLVAGMDTEPFWQESRLIDMLMPLVAWMHGFLPTDIGTTA